MVYFCAAILMNRVDSKWALKTPFHQRLLNFKECLRQHYNQSKTMRKITLFLIVVLFLKEKKKPNVKCKQKA